MEKKSFGENLEAFFAGKGFYIVLFLCAAVIGVSAWSMLAGNATDVEEPAKIETSLEQAERREQSRAVAKDVSPVITEPAQTQPLPEATAVPEAPAVQESVNEPEEQNEAGYSAFYMWPLNGEIENPYSMDVLVYNRTMGDWRTHDGIDIAAEVGAQVMATSDGEVEAVIDDPMYGSTVVISHGGGLRSVYSNLAALPTVQAGDSVVTGQVIGSVGDTALCETSEAAHLHFSMSLDGESVDPTAYMP